VRDPFQLRALPHEHLFLYNKRIDNSRLVREADPKSRGACWSAIGAASVLAILLTSAFAPSVATTIAGYKLEALRIEERRLLEEHRGLDLQEAELLSPARWINWPRAEQSGGSVLGPGLPPGRQTPRRGCDGKVGESGGVNPSRCASWWSAVLHVSPSSSCCGARQFSRT
jgi:hypothetical protein